MKISEREIYESVRSWLGSYLRGIHPRAEIRTYDTHSVQLSTLIASEGLQRMFPDYSAYEIKVDVTAVVLTSTSARLAFVECKIGPITLRDVGQLLGYSLVAQPEISILVSPKGLSDRLSALLVTLGRTDILAYGNREQLRLATWDLIRNEVKLSSLLPKGSHHLTRKTTVTHRLSTS